MAESTQNSSNTGVVAVLVVFILALILIFFAYRGGMFGPKKTDVDIKIGTPSSTK